MEPGERVMVSQITLINAGELTLPAGAIVTFQSTATIQFDQVAIRSRAFVFALD